MGGDQYIFYWRERRHEWSRNEPSLLFRAQKIESNNVSRREETAEDQHGGHRAHEGTTGLVLNYNQKVPSGSFGGRDLKGE